MSGESPASSVVKDKFALKILPPLRGVPVAARDRGLSPPANFGQALRANSAHDLVSVLISRDTSVMAPNHMGKFCRPCGTQGIQGTQLTKRRNFARNLRDVTLVYHE